MMQHKSSSSLFATTKCQDGLLMELTSSSRRVILT